MSADGSSRADLARSLAWLGLAGLGTLWTRGPFPSQAVPTGGAPLSAGTDMGEAPAHGGADRGPGEEHPDDAEGPSGLKGYTIGLALAALLTALSFGLPATGLVWGPAVPAALVVLAIAQMGVHLVFFLHLTTGPDNTNNAMALAFGALIAGLVIGGTLWIMAHLNANMMPMGQMMDMQR